MASDRSISDVLQQLLAAGVVVPPGRLRIDRYGDSEALCEELLDLIRVGRKRAGSRLLWGVQAHDEELPEVGDIEIVLDFHDAPVLLTRVLEVEVVAFMSVTSRYAAIEGEGDGSLAQWRERHWAFFSRDCDRIGRHPSDEMPVVCSVFELLGEVPRHRAT